MQHLQPNTTLQGGKYRIERVLGQGGFGNTYIATNTEFEETVAIKEFFMKGVTERDETTSAISVGNADNVQKFEEQREKFKKEARRLRKLSNEHLVKVYDLFDEKGTSYYVMEYIDGENLAERLKRTGKPFSEKKLREILPQILDALKTVHLNGFCHLDLKPSNIMLEKSGLIKLIDFGASKQLGANGTLTTNDPTALAQTPGFAPREQMEQNFAKIGAWTDIYALGATLYNLLTNNRPPMPSDIDDDSSKDKHLALPLPAEVSNQMRQLILWLMKTHRLERPSTVKEIQEFINKKEDDDVTVVDGSKVSPPYKKGDSMKKMILAAFSVVILAIGLFFLLSSISKEEQPSLPINEDIVDLGLPSGTIWGTRNLGAKEGHDGGLYYTWGGIKPVVSQPNLSSIEIRNISGTSFDAALISLGKGWCIPNIDQFRELIYECKWEKTDTGYVIKGPNGNTMFLPFAGCVLKDSIKNQGEFGYYWTSENLERDGANGATELLIGGPHPARFESGKRNVGRSIRPVYTKPKSNYNL